VTFGDVSVTPEVTHVFEGPKWHTSEGPEFETSSKIDGYERASPKDTTGARGSSSPESKTFKPQDTLKRELEDVFKSMYRPSVADDLSSSFDER